MVRFVSRKKSREKIDIRTRLVPMMGVATPPQSHTIPNFNVCEMQFDCVQALGQQREEGFRAFKENQYLNREWICVSDMRSASKMRWSTNYKSV